MSAMPLLLGVETPESAAVSLVIRAVQMDVDWAICERVKGTEVGAILLGWLVSVN